MLNPKQQAFIAAYISNGWNGTQAAISAGYKHPSVVASQLLRKLKVRNEIDAALRNHQLCASQVLARLSEMANASIGDFMDNNGDVALS
ncbi:MAG: terminase small subunit, partial [Verrucomicrobiota bacterium]